MLPPKIPENETQRLELLEKIQVLETPIEERFERITRLVCKSLRVPIAAVSIIDGERQWLKSAQGLGGSQAPRYISFCAHAIVDEGPYIIADALSDERFRDNPMVTSEPNIRAYAAYPLDMGDGLRVGTLCAIDTTPRIFEAEELEVLEDLAAMVRSELQNVALSQGYRDMLDELDAAERAALIDHLTRLWNRAGGTNLLTREWQIAQRNTSKIAIGLLDIDHFKKVNDTYGHDVGDEVIVHIGKTILTALRTSDIVCRWGGEEYLLICPGCDRADLSATLDRIHAAIRKAPIATSAGDLSVSVSIGATTLTPALEMQVEPVLKAADDALYAAKNNGRNGSVIV